MAPTLEQSAYNTVAKEQSRTCTATFTKATTPGNLIVVMVAAAGTLPSNLRGPAGFTLVANRGLRDIQLAVWYRQASPSITSVSVTALDDDKSLQVRALELSGMAQANVLDRLAVNTGESQLVLTGSTGTTSQAEELVLGVVVNQYASTSQFGFGGGLSRLYETTSPQTWSRGSNVDWERSRMSVHAGTTKNTGSFSMLALLSATRRWLTVLMTFRSGATGPARFTSTQQGPMLSLGGYGSLTVFGPLRSVEQNDRPMFSHTGVNARIGPYNYQYRLGGWDGLLIGDDTPYRVENHDGLEGWIIRTSDDELPRGDGALRGVDLMAARQILFELKVGGTQDEVEEAMDTLYRALVPQRDSDWELIWRHPGRPLRMLRCRPVNLTRNLSWRETLVNHQKFSLLATDPRHYSAAPRTVHIPNTPAGGISAPTPTSAINAGNGNAYPTITIAGPPDGSPPVTRVELVNNTFDVTFVVEALLPPNSTLVGDMEARAIGAPRSVVTIDGQSKYGAWQHPRQTFVLGPGENLLHLITEPAGAPVSCQLDYRDTWSG